MTSKCLCLSKELRVRFWCILVINSGKVQRSGKDEGSRKKLTLELTHLISVTYLEIFWEDQVQQGVWGGGLWCPLCVQGKTLVRTRWQSFRKLQEFITLKSLLIKIYSSQPLMKLIQNIFFKHLANNHTFF